MAEPRRSVKVFRVSLIALLLAAMALPLLAAPVEELIQARAEIPEDLLLDVSIEIFDPGLPEGADAALAMADKGLFDDVRETEARYVPVRLMMTLQASAHWGAVRVVPPGTGSAEVVVRGEILESNGMRLAVRVQAQDVAGRPWLDREYKEKADPRAYLDEEDADTAGLVEEPFQNLYHRLANDLLAARDKLDRKRLLELRTIARLRFAADLAPLAFEGYLGTNRRGRPALVRLPTDEDPMLERVDRVRERDYLLVDTLSEYYATFEASMAEPYGEWRRMSYEEEMARRKIKRQARNRKILGALAILGGVIAESEGNGSGVGDVAIIAGAMVMQSGFAKSQEAKIHVEALRELAASLDAEMKPLLINVEGEALRLTGSAETQYLTWREILREIFLEETGLPVDPDDPTRLAGTPEG